MVVFKTMVAVLIYAWQSAVVYTTQVPNVFVRTTLRLITLEESACVSYFLLRFVCKN